ncbi:MAG TPA: hypothetical protein VMA83_08970 [Solirubrobacteraceae bacterium]|nr:hypothetical protein [Solirubrobacteraceae bacterium]
MATAHKEIDERGGELFAGGVDGNELLTISTGAVLFVLLAALGVTILMVGTLIEEHLIIGLVLIPPVALKLASTGWRFTKYYTHDEEYVEKGPPQLFLRLLAPLVVLTTIVVFASGVVLLFEGPHAHNTMFLIHKVSFFAWLAVTALHVLAHLPEMQGGLRADWGSRNFREDIPGRSGRGIALASAIVLGVVLAVVLIGEYAPWVHYMHGAH